MNDVDAVGAVVYRVNSAHAIEVLVIRKLGGYWTLSKGKLKRGESPECGLVREVREETGLIVEPLDLIAQARYFTHHRKPKAKRVVYLSAIVLTGKVCPQLSEGIIAVRWIKLDRAQKLVTRPRIRAVLRSAQTLLGV
ncbi:NUDIX domain-containing protein [Candidatus Gracilibacteria bacterium]|nr:NUDIX domain-containing protein [Candidatus Gracilibacteria bacterium]